MTTDPVERATELLDRARSDPAATDPEAFGGLLAAEEPQARRYAVDGLRLLAGQESGVLDERADRVAALLADPDEGVRAAAADAFANGTTPAVAADNAGKLADLLDDEFPVAGRNALEALVRAARADPGSCRAFVDDVAPFLDADTDQARTHAATVLAAVAAAHPDAVVPLVDRLLDALRSDAENGNGVDADRSVRGDHPAVRSHVERLTDRTVGRRRDLRLAAGRALRDVARADPAAVAPETDALAALLDDPDPEVRRASLDVLAAIADEHPDRVADHTEAVAALLDDREGVVVRAGACRALAAVGADEPDAVAAAVVGRVDHLRSLLDHEEAPTRASAARLLLVVTDADAADTLDDG